MELQSRWESAAQSETKSDRYEDAKIGDIGNKFPVPGLNTQCIELEIPTLELKEGFSLRECDGRMPLG
jgi:hypothetical protein